MVNNKVCIIVGEGDAVCAWSAKEMAKNGYVTAIVDRDIDAVKRIADEICTFGGLAKAYMGERADVSSLVKVRDSIVAEFGKCNVIVNILSGNSTEEILAPIQVFAADMIDESGCSIVNICCNDEHEADICELTRNMAVNLADKDIRVNAIVHGEIITRGNRDKYYDDDNLPTEACQRIIDTIPMKRLCKPEEIIGALKYLSDAVYASYTTGIVIHVDGGYHGAHTNT